MHAGRAAPRRADDGGVAREPGAGVRGHRGGGRAERLQIVETQRQHHPGGLPLRVIRILVNGDRGQRERLHQQMMRRAVDGGRRRQRLGERIAKGILPAVRGYRAVRNVVPDRE